MIIWMVVNHSMTSSKVVQNVPIRVINLPPGKTVSGMQTNGILNERITLTLQGNKTALDEIYDKDIEVVLDATGKPNEWIATIGKKEIVSLNPDFVPTKELTRVIAKDRPIKQSNLVTEKIPVIVTQPIGETPKGYQYVDVFPYQLTVTATGPEETIKRFKARGGLKLTFNLNDISKAELDTLQPTARPGESDEVSYLIPDSWKKISVPSLSETPLVVDDLQARNLRIIFSKQDLLPIGVPIPITLFFPNKNSNTINPETYTLATNDFVVKKNGIKVIVAPLYAQGISRRFLDLVKHHMHIVVIAAPKSEREYLDWHVQIIYPIELENQFVAKMLSEAAEELSDIEPHQREDFLRNRFRYYIHNFRLYTQKNEKFRLKIKLETNTISVNPGNE